MLGDFLRVLLAKQQPDQRQLGIAKRPTSRPVPEYGGMVGNNGAQALQQQQNLYYKVQDPPMQGSHALPFYMPASDPGSMYEDHAIGGADIQMAPWLRSPQITAPFSTYNKKRR